MAYFKSFSFHLDNVKERNIFLQKCVLIALTIPDFLKNAHKRNIAKIHFITINTLIIII